ncbi:hypothetical protein GB937_002520 [Aspergillus fischeri]|nr:hypothetical protein GB937_002520 [Aspergillus fischeri]
MTPNLREKHAVSEFLQAFAKLWGKSSGHQRAIAFGPEFTSTGYRPGAGIQIRSSPGFIQG